MSAPTPPPGLIELWAVPGVRDFVRMTVAVTTAHIAEHLTPHVPFDKRLTIAIDTTNGVVRHLDRELAP